MAKAPAPLELRLNSAERRALAAFLGGRLPAGQIHAELCRAAAQAAPLPSDTASSPVPTGARVRRLSRSLRAA